MGFKKAADGVTQKGKTEGKNLGDSGPTAAAQKGKGGNASSKKLAPPTGFQPHCMFLLPSPMKPAASSSVLPLKLTCKPFNPDAT